MGAKGMGTQGGLWGPAYGDLWGLVWTYWALLAPMGTYRNLWPRVGMHENLWGTGGTCGDLSMGTSGALWGPLGTYRLLWGPMVTFGGPMGTFGDLIGPLGRGPMAACGDLWPLAYGDQ